MNNALLVTLADRNFIDQAKQLFSSVYWNAGWKGDYMLLAHEIPEKDLKWFRDKGILVKKCKPLENKFIGKDHPIMLDKFYLFAPEFKKWKNIVYIDTDIIVRASLDRLADVKGFWAVRDYGYKKLEMHFKSNFEEELSKFDKRLNLNAKAFNAGIFAFSTDLIEKDGFRRLVKLFKKYVKILKFSDQSVLNLFFYKKWNRLSFLYDVYPIAIIKKDHFSANKIKAVILHFVRRDDDFARPWERGNPFYTEWKFNLKKAEKINLNSRPCGTRYSNQKIWFYTIQIKVKQKLLGIKRLFLYIFRTPSRILGAIGQAIKKMKPNLYYKLKKIW